MDDGIEDCDMVAGEAATAGTDHDGGLHGGGPPVAHGLQLSQREGERLLNVISRASGVKRHFELYQLLQGDVQALIPHRTLVCAWGNFRGVDLQLDVISCLPGVRTARLENCNIADALRSLHFRWVAEERPPLLIDGRRIITLARPACDCALHRSLRDTDTVLVHGVHDARDGTDILYLAALERSFMNEREVERFKFMADSAIAQIDVAFRKVAGLQLPARSGGDGDLALSSREEEILGLVAEGRTNAEIAGILAVSVFTVKNHVQRVIKKLGAANRTEAASKHRRMQLTGNRQILSNADRNDSSASRVAE